MAPPLEPSAGPHAPLPVAAPTPSAPPASASLEPVALPYARRFRLLLGALVAIAAGTLAFAGALLARDSSSGEPQASWSSWQPRHRGVAGAGEIAAHIAPTYRLADGRQLVAVRGGALSLDLPSGNLPLRILLQSAPIGGNLSYIDGESVLYVLAGTGPYGAVEAKRQSVSEARGVLLRREALELALYSLHDLGVDNVVALLPPAPGDKPKNALFFRRRDLAPQLKAPLERTLPDPPPTLAELAAGPMEGASVLALTDPHTFTFSFSQAQDLGAAIVLAPAPKGG